MKKSTIAFTFILLMSFMMTVSPGYALFRHDIRNQVVYRTVQYQEIKVGNVPAAITVSLSRDFFGYKVDKAYLGNDGNYKLLIRKEKVKFNIFCKKDGELIRMEPCEEPELQNPAN
jgi:hypothetical protein